MKQCPVCVQAGKSDTMHHIKDNKGKVICPTLLSQNCRNCGEIGHTPKYCKVLLKTSRRDAYNDKKATTEKISRKKTSTRQSVFSALTCDSDSEESDNESDKVIETRVEHTVKKDEKPSEPRKKTWAEIMVDESDDETDKAIETTVENVVKMFGNYTEKRKKTWAEMMEEESDDEE